jgi:hypothetical protein
MNQQNEQKRTKKEQEGGTYQGTGPTFDPNIRLLGPKLDQNVPLYNSRGDNVQSVKKHKMLL